MTTRRGSWMLALVLMTSLTVSARALGDARPDEPRPPFVRSRTAELQRLFGDDLWSAPGRAARVGGLPCDGTPVGPPPNPSIGDAWNWYIWSLAGFPVGTLHPCTVRGMSEHAYVVVENSQWNVRMNQAKVDAILEEFENHSIGSFPTQGIWDLDTSHFGDPPDHLDQDPRVYLLYYDFDVNADGFFWAFDQECDDVASFHSNECDVVYLNCSDFDPAGTYMLAVVAHEFQHLIHYNYDPDEASWVNEGLGELAMWLYGNPDDISAFNTNPDRSLLTFDGVWADYIKTYLFNLYFYERYGGQPAVRALVAAPGNGITGYEVVLDALGYTQDFDDVFADWVIANYLDDTSIAGGRFGYVGETLPPFQPFATWSTYPVGPANATVQHWASDYVRYLAGSDLHLTFDGADNNRFSVRAMLLDDVNATMVVDMPLNAAQSGALTLPQVGTTHDEAVVSYASVQTAGTMTYTYGAQSDVVGVGSVPATEGPTFEVRHAGAGLFFRVGVPADAAGMPLRIDVFDVAGRLAARIADRQAAAGVAEISWDGGTSAGLPPGSYFARLRLGPDEAVVRALVVR